MTKKNLVRLGAASLAVGGIFFVFYPAIRPFSNETSLQGAEAFASSAWIVAHVFAMLGFVLIALGALGLYVSLRETAVERLASLSVVVIWLGAGLTLPFYGAEAFGLHVIGQEALRRHSAAVLDLASDVRSGPGLLLFLSGLLLVAVGAILLATTIWRSRNLPRWSGVPFAAGFVLFIPQFYGNHPLRVAHGLLVAAGCIWIAAGLRRQSN